MTWAAARPRPDRLTITSILRVRLPFVATWYTLGIALTAALGALLGPRLLRW